MTSVRMIVGICIVIGLSGPALAQDAARGKKVFNKCRSCHTVGDNAQNKVGPHLNDLFGRVAGTLDDFKFSDAMVDQGTNGLVWTEATLTAFLQDPRGLVDGTKMSFRGLRKEQDIVNLLTYLETYSN